MSDKLKLEQERRLNQWPHWPDARGWIGIGVFAISVMLLWMMKDSDLRKDEFFQTIATVIISNGLIAVVAWAYAATKGGGEMFHANVKVAQALADKTELGTNGKPLETKVVNDDRDPVPVATEPKDANPDLPEYAR